MLCQWLINKYLLLSVMPRFVDIFHPQKRENQNVCIEMRLCNWLCLDYVLAEWNRIPIFIFIGYFGHSYLFKWDCDSFLLHVIPSTASPILVKLPNVLFSDEKHELCPYMRFRCCDGKANGVWHKRRTKISILCVAWSWEAFWMRIAKCVR